MRVEPVSGRDVEFRLAHEIVSGIEDTLYTMFETEPGFILKSKFLFPDERLRGTGPANRAIIMFAGVY